LLVAYDEELADRVREHLDEAHVRLVTEQEMFGGISFMIAGNMCCGVLGDDLVVRIDPTLHHDALTRPDVSEFTMGGRTSKGMIRVAPSGIEEELDLALWLRLGIAHATSLPARKAGAKKKTASKTKAATKKKAAARKAPARKATPAKKRAAPVKKKKAAAPAKKRPVAVKKKKAPVKKKATRTRK
jgi:hypothetical protein